MRRHFLWAAAVLLIGTAALPALAIGGSTGAITGTVLDQETGAPFPTGGGHLLMVDAYNVASMERYKTGPIGATGAYTIANLPPGDYKVRFRHVGAGGDLDRYLWYHPAAGTHSFATAASVHVVAAASFTLNVSLPALTGAAASGTLTENGSGDPVGNPVPAEGCVFVTLYEASGVGLGLVYFPDAAGDWQSSGLVPSGQWTALAGYSKWCPDGPSHLDRWYQGASGWPLQPDNLVADPRTFATADLFTIIDGVSMAGIDFVLLPAPTCRGRTPTVYGTTLADAITGTPGRDVIVGLAGADHISGLEGNDFICGNAGRDDLVGGAGRDRLLGNAGNDTLAGQAGDDTLRGGPGRDRADGGLGTDICSAETVSNCP